VWLGRTLRRIAFVQRPQRHLVGILASQVASSSRGLSYGCAQIDRRNFLVPYGIRISIMFWCAWSGVVRVVVWEVFVWLWGFVGAPSVVSSWRPVGGSCSGREVFAVRSDSHQQGFHDVVRHVLARHFEYGGSLGLASDSGRVSPSGFGRSSACLTRSSSETSLVRL